MLVSDSSTTGKKRRWLGIIYTYNNSGTVNFKDDVNYRYVSNFYNRENKAVESWNTNNSWTASGSAWRASYNGDGAVYENFILCQSQQAIASASGTFAQTGSVVYGYTGMHFNTMSNRILECPAIYVANVTSSAAGSSYISIPVGYNYILLTEYASGNITIYSNYGMKASATITIEV